MKRTFLLTAALILVGGSSASAQVVVRAPFVRVEVGPGGTYVRAPFVQYYSGPPIYVMPPPAGVAPVVVGRRIAVPGTVPAVIPPPGLQIAPPVDVPPVIQEAPPAAKPNPAIPQPLPRGDASAPPAPNPPPAAERLVPNNADLVPPPPAKGPQELTLGNFAKSFEAKEGSYEVRLLNPVTNAPTTVRFNLPAGQPEVMVGPAAITYRYAGRSMVKIEFDADGATVISR